MTSRADHGEQENGCSDEDLNIQRQRPVSIFAFLQRFKVVCDAYNMHKGMKIYSPNHYRNGPVVFAIRTRVALLAKTSEIEEGCSKSYFTTVNTLLKQYETDDHIVSVGAKIDSLKQGGLTATDYAKQLWTITLTCISVYT